MSKAMSNKMMRRSRRGLVLLLALGMLALFSLLAVTYIVAASNSRAGAMAMKIRANASNTSTRGLGEEVLMQTLRGTRDPKSAFYQHALLEDVYDSRATRVRFGNRSTDPSVLPSIPAGAFNANWCVRLTPYLPATTGVELVKISLDPRNANLAAGLPPTYALSPFENAYNSRVLTVLEGPLAGYSFRILKYVGFVRSTLNIDSAFPDPNTPSNPAYTRPDAFEYDYSIAIDLTEVKGSLRGRWRNTVTGRIENFSGSIGDWISLPNGEGLRNLFYFCDTGTQSYQGYRCVINGAAFSNAGIGLEDDPTAGVSSYGNLDGSRWMAITTPQGKVPPALLPNYDYIQDLRYMTAYNGKIGVYGIGDDVSTLLGEPKLRGQSNEGYDVPDWRDFWLAHQDRIQVNATTVVPHITPSFHRPELINYIAHLFGDPSSLDPNQVRQLLLMLDASTARVLNYQFGTSATANPNFDGGPGTVALPAGFTWSTPTPTPGEIAALRTFVRAQIEGSWDVDNDGDGVPDSVWVDPNLTVIHAPNGQMLKPLVAVMIEDLDGRINLNLHGDRVQGQFNSFNAFADSAGFLRANLSGPLPLNLPQGLGYGPADISLNQLFSFNLEMLTSTGSNFSIFDERYGAKRHHDSTAAINLATMDRSPGRRRDSTFDGDDVVSLLRQRETRQVDPALSGSNIHGRLPGMPLGRRSAVAPAFDRNGNLSFVHPSVIDAFPENPLNSAIPSEREGDAYETSAGATAYGDTPFTAAELERILRRFDDDVEALPEHLREHLEELPGYDNLAEINRVITTRSAELRLPKLAAAASIPTNSGATLEKDAGNLLGFIRLVHEQRYRKRSFPPNLAVDEPALNVEALYQLFPPEFASNLRMDINRAFGNGVDDNDDGNVDEPRELAVSAELEFGHNGIVPQVSNSPGAYRNRQRDLGSNSRAYLGSRQLLARYLYCLGQLMIPRDHEFPTMQGESRNSLKWYRLRARAIAQWAVNVVDFRDADVAMTRFEYDIFPFGVNEASFGAKYNPKQAYWAPDTAPVDRDFVGVVWGMEMPELLLTESLAFHDKRLRDTDMDSGPDSTTIDSTSPDPDMDQYRFPEGSLFLELFATRTTYFPEDNRIAGTSSSLHDVRAGFPVKLDLSRMAPADPSNYWGSQPVWRIGINASTPSGHPDAGKQPNVLYQRNQNDTEVNKRDFQASKASVLLGDSGSPIPEIRVGSGLVDDLDDLGSATPPAVTFERMIWFATAAPNSRPRIPDLEGNDNNNNNANRRNRVYYNRGTGPALLEGGSYAVVGPRRETRIGSLKNNPDTGTPWISRLEKGQMALNRPVRSPSHQSINLDSNNVVTTLLNGVNIFRYRTEWRDVPKQSLSVVCAADTPQEIATPPNRWADCFPDGVGVNISMPNPIKDTGYWRDENKPLVRLNRDDLKANRSDERLGYGDTGIDPDSWVDCTETPVGKFPDKPFDYNPSRNNILTPTSGSAMNRTGTYPNVRTAFLQRLADPNMPYDPINNPYITVDWISLDLTVFNGEAPTGDDPQDAGGSQIAFQSRYKDGASRATASSKANIASGSSQPAPRVGPNMKVTQGGNAIWGYSYHSFSTAQLRETRKQNLVALDPPLTGPGAERYESYFMHQLGYISQQPSDVEGSQPKHHSATTLGYANVGYRFGSVSGTANDDADDFDGFGPPQLVAGNVLYNGSPRDLTSLVWFNRPFATPAELMMVPLTSPGQLGLFHSIANPAELRSPFEYLPSFGTANALVTNLSETGATSDWADYAATPDNVNARNRIRAEGYWLKRSGYWASAATTPVETDWASLLEFIETKPPFIDSAKFLQPDAVLGAATTNAVANRFLNSYIPNNFTGASEPDSVRGPSLLAPTNEIPNYTAAGKINLNTITLAQSGRSEALQALEYLYLVGSQRTGAVRDVITQRFFRTRRGFDGAGMSNFFGVASNPWMDPNYPTQFAGAYRSGLASNIQPLAPYPNPANREPRMQQRGRYPIESTVLRSYTPNQSVNAMPNTGNFGSMLFSPDAIARIEDPSNIPGVNQLELDDAQRNAFTRYQRAMRLPNLVTDQSNVFAVWVTVGLFEYDPVNGFGREYVNASGEEQRERSFYIIDRTVPVGFIPGENLNTEKTILLQRKISGDR
jgi:hypothetical protein